MLAPDRLSMECSDNYLLCHAHLPNGQDRQVEAVSGVPDCWPTTMTFRVVGGGGPSELPQRRSCASLWRRTSAQ